MRLDIRLFAVARQRAGRSMITVDVPDRATVGDLKRALSVECPALAPLLPSLRIAVDAEYADDGHVIPAGAELAVIPPVSGGSGGTAPSPAARRSACRTVGA